MTTGEIPCLSLAIARLTKAGTENFAVWVLKSPYPGGYVHHDSLWTPELSQSWLGWQEVFSVNGSPLSPVNHPELKPELKAKDTNPGQENAGDGELPQEPEHNLANNLVKNPEGNFSKNTGTGSTTNRLMQDLGVQLWQWLFAGTIQNSFAQSQGIAMGQNKPLRLRLEIRDPNFISLPWEIMQPQSGQQAISLKEQILFSRTTSDVDPLLPQRLGLTLKILVVLGAAGADALDLEAEAVTLSRVWQQPRQAQVIANRLTPAVPAQVDTLTQPTPQELIRAIDNGGYNIFFYGGHGIPAADGGLLFLREDAALNGTELAQVLVRNQVTLAVFNACWLAFPAQIGNQAMPRSSLAEVLIHHGVPAVLGMRDAIADHEALSFIQNFAQALAVRMPIDQAVTVARQHLLTLYKFNQPAWTLPILYMHPEFNGELIRSIEEGITELPGYTSLPEGVPSKAYLRDLGGTNQVWYLQGGVMRVGRRPENDLIIQERWVSQQHAEILCREDLSRYPTYLLRDFSRYGTLIYSAQGWQKVHHQEIELKSGMKIKFGSSHGQSLEFVIDEVYK